MPAPSSQGPGGEGPASRCDGPGEKNAGTKSKARAWREWERVHLMSRSRRHPRGPLLCTLCTRIRVDGSRNGWLPVRGMMARLLRRAGAGAGAWALVGGQQIDSIVWLQWH